MISDDVAKSLKHDWQAGLLSIRLLAIRYNLAADKIRQLAEGRNWGEQGRLRDAIDRAATSALVDRTVSLASNDHQDLLNDADSIDRYGQIVAGVVESQRQDIAKGRGLAGKLLAELNDLAPVEVDENAIEAMACAVQQDNPELAAQLRQGVTSHTFDQRVGLLGKRISMLDTLSGAQQKYIKLEREAYGLDANAAPQTGIDELIDPARKQIEAAK